MGIIRKVRGVQFWWKHTGELSKYLMLAGLLCTADQAVKYAVDTEPEDNFPRDLPHTGGYAGIQRVHNSGFAMGKLQAYPELIRMVPLGMTAILSGLLAGLCQAGHRSYRVRKAGLALVIGGALSNLIDRIRLGYVVDYLHIRVGVLKKLVINLGDLLILIGGVLYLAAFLFGKED